MATREAINPGECYGKGLRERGGGRAYRCYQCGTCTSVCELASQDFTFPRRQMLLTQWGQVEALSEDASVWLCHQCNDCSLRCPRDAKPGDVMQTARSLVVEELSTPKFMGKLVARAGYTWPILLGVPLIFWVVALYFVNGLKIPGEPLVYEHFVPHGVLYAVFFTVTGLATLASLVSGVRFWQKLGRGETRNGSMLGHIVPALLEIAQHERFGKCGGERVRRWGHFSLMWGFVGAAVTSGFIIVVMYILKEPLPLPLTHWVKILGNISAILLIVGTAVLVLNRFQEDTPTNATSGFDGFFIGLVFLLVTTGVLVEAGRFLFDPALACYLYIGHLAVVLCLFGTFPYSKFAHMMYRTLALVHERMIKSGSSNPR